METCGNAIHSILYLIFCYFSFTDFVYSICSNDVFVRRDSFYKVGNSSESTYDNFYRKNYSFFYIWMHQSRRSNIS